MTEHLVHNEQVKLQATALNNTAIALFISGTLQTVLSWTRDGTEPNPLSFTLGLSLWVFAAFLHRWAVMLLGRLREKDMEDGS
jgi:hypothetical protein